MNLVSSELQGVIQSFLNRVACLQQQRNPCAATKIQILDTIQPEDLIEDFQGIFAKSVTQLFSRIFFRRFDVKEKSRQKQVENAIVIGIGQHSLLPHLLDPAIRKSLEQHRHVLKLKMRQAVQNQLFIRKQSVVPYSLVRP